MRIALVEQIRRFINKRNTTIGHRANERDYPVDNRFDTGLPLTSVSDHDSTTINNNVITPRVINLPARISELIHVSNSMSGDTTFKNPWPGLFATVFASHSAVDVVMVMDAWLHALGTTNTAPTIINSNTSSKSTPALSLSILHYALKSLSRVVTFTENPRDTLKRRLRVVQTTLKVWEDRN